MDLQLTSLIDVFSMLVIFLVLTTFLGQPEIQMPGDLHLPRSASKETVDVSPTVVISKAGVTFVNILEPVQIPQLQQDKGLHAKIKEVAEAQPKDKNAGKRLLTVVADKDTEYKHVFDVMKVFREQGFDTLLFVATAGETKK